MSQEPTLARRLVGLVKSGELPFWIAFAVAVLSLPFIAWAQASGPAITSAPSASAVTENSAVISWQTDRLSTTVVTFGETSALGETYRKIVPIEEAEVFEAAHSMTLWQLRAGTTYHYKVASVDEAGGRTESAIFTFQTASPAPVVNPPELEVPPVPPTEPVELEAPEDGPTVVAPEPPPAPVSPPKTVPETTVVPKSEPVAAIKPTGPKPAVAPAAPKPSRPAPEPAAPASVAPPPAPPVDGRSAESPAGPVAPMPAFAVSEKMDKALAEFRSITGAMPTSAPVAAPAPEGIDGRVAATLVDAGETQPPLDPLCVGSGIGAVRCRAWLGARYADKTCADAGLTTRESCEAFLTERNGGVFPGCEGGDDEACRRAKELTTLGYLPAEAREMADAVIALARAEAMVPSVPEITSVSASAAPGADWRASAAAPGAETSPAVVVLDADRDGLPDDFERVHGTNPDVADTDGDGIGDAEEMRAGTDPLGAGGVQRKLDPTALAVVNRVPIEQPRGAGSVSEEFGVRAPVAGFVPGEVSAPGTGTVISGTCASSSTCLIYIYSYAPLVFTTVADENGNWTYDLGETVGDGEHTVYVAVTDETGRIERKSNPLSFFVSEARAVSVDDFLKSDVSAPSEPVDRYQRRYVWGLVGLIAVAVGVAGLVLRRYSRTKAGT